jgi:polyisoprenoid-binding protein YceI
MRLTPILFAAILGAAPAAAAPATYTVDANHTSLYFRIDHVGYSRVWGRFDAMRGTIEFDPDAPANGGIALTIDAASVDTNHADRDDHLRSPDFLNAAEFPEIAFRSTAIEVTGEATAVVTGELTMLGVSRPVALVVTYNRMAPYPFADDQIRIGFSATGRIVRSDFGMTYALDALGDEVELFLEVEAFR